MMQDELRRAELAFPDEDVLVGTRFPTASGFEAFKALNDVVPRPDHRASGEERAWGRRLAKRFGVDAKYDANSFVAKQGQSGFLDHESSKPDKLDPEVVEMFAVVDPAAGDAMVAYGWTMAEDLVKLGQR